MSDPRIKDLEDVKGVLDRHGVVYFLEYGTALGAYRDGDFLPDDHDIDIGVVGQEKLPQIKDDLQKIGFKHKDVELYIATERSFLFDIHFYREEPGWFQCWLTSTESYLFYPKRFIRNMNEIVFHGMSFKILAPPEDYLAWVYGADWQDKSSRKSSKYDWRNKPV